MHLLSRHILKSPLISRDGKEAGVRNNIQAVLRWCRYGNELSHQTLIWRVDIIINAALLDIIGTAASIKCGTVTESSKTQFV